nr:hypothetical protein CFP56_28040 [Quercus suber]
MACPHAHSQVHDSPMGKQPWQRHPAKIKAAPMGKAAMAKARNHGHGSPHRQEAKAKATPMGSLPRPKHSTLPK